MSEGFNNFLTVKIEMSVSINTYQGLYMRPYGNKCEL
jgi:hypothetical protein